MWRHKYCETAWHCQRSVFKNSQFDFWICEQYRLQSLVSDAYWLWYTLLYLWASQGSHFILSYYWDSWLYELPSYFLPDVICEYSVNCWPDSFLGTSMHGVSLEVLKDFKSSNDVPSSSTNWINTTIFSVVKTLLNVSGGLLIGGAILLL